MKYIHFLFILIHLVSGRIHKLELHNDSRESVVLSSFGFYKNGFLRVNIDHLLLNPYKPQDTFGFTLHKTKIEATNPYLENHLEYCVLTQPNFRDTTANSIYFIMDLKNKTLNVFCTGIIPPVLLDEFESTPKDASVSVRTARELARKDGPTDCIDNKLPINVNFDEKNKLVNISLRFYIKIATVDQEGLYSLYFHSCPNYSQRKPVRISMDVEVEENNNGNFLSAGEMPLPTVYSMLALLFFLSGCYWVFILRNSKHPVFKTHYMMTVLVFLKSLSLLFHGINYHFIEIQGKHNTTWAILYYITHLLKGSVLFVVVVLVGTGWTFIKPALSKKDRKLFVIIIPFQLLLQAADIILEESEDGAYFTFHWRHVLILMDVICSIAIIVPVAWSIHHLESACETDGKAEMSLKKLQLFKQFYLMVVGYLYITKIAMYLLQLTMHYQFQWLDEMVRELATYAFYVLTAYLFQPESDNPYFQLPIPDDEITDIVLTESGLKEGLKKVNRPEPANKGTEEEMQSMINNMETSYEYD